MTQSVIRTQWLGIPLSERLRYMANELNVPHPSMIKVLLEMRRLVTRCKATDRGTAMLVLAGSGCGKTHLINTVKKLKPPNHTGYVSQVPVVSFSIPSKPTEKAMGVALLRAIEYPRPNIGSADELFERAVHQVRAIGTEIIMIDNVHDIPERRSEGGIMQVGNWIRNLIDRTECLIVMLGTPAAIQVTTANAQLRRRVSKRMGIRYFDISADNTARVFKRFLAELDKLLPLAEHSRLDEPKVMQRIYWATGGITDYIMQLVSEAVGLAVEDGREQIVLSDIESAFKLVFQDSALGLNPFSENGPSRLLDQPGEPFYNWFDTSNPNIDDLPGTWGKR